MRHISVDRQRGLSLVELVISMAIFLVILLGIYQVFDTSRLTYVSGERKVDTQQNVRTALDLIAREIRMAGYFPENFDTSTANDMPSPVALQVAATNGLAIFGDADGSNASNVFVYCLSGNTIIRQKSSQSGTGKGKPASDAVAAYTCAASTANTLAEDITGLTFTYYDTNGAVLTPGAQSALDGEGMNVLPPFASVTQRSAARTVVVTLTAQESVPGQSQAQEYTLTQVVRLRNMN
jgi:prepilin-type N-terminal cleavage/methylation domain-containing protein